jgi:polyisoprenoid-binding protein YceI
MPVFTSDDAELLVFTRKEGLLSRLGHDLKLAADRFRIEVDPETGRVEASCEARSLSVRCALRDGRDEPGELSPDNRAEIDRNLQRDVLDSAHHPEIRLQGTATPTGTAAAAYQIRGTLSLRGATRPVEIAARRDGEQLVAELTLHQPDFGIRPFSAALGALRVHPDVRIVVRLPVAGLTRQ